MNVAANTAREMFSNHRLQLFSVLFMLFHVPFRDICVRLVSFCDGQESQCIVRYFFLPIKVYCRHVHCWHGLVHECHWQWTDGRKHSEHFDLILTVEEMREFDIDETVSSVQRNQSLDASDRMSSISLEFAASSRTKCHSISYCLINHVSCRRSWRQSALRSSGHERIFLSSASTRYCCFSRADHDRNSKERRKRNLFSCIWNKNVNRLVASMRMHAVFILLKPRAWSCRHVHCIWFYQSIRDEKSNY